MTPFHAGFIRELRTSTALQLSAASLVSENVRHVRKMAVEYVEVAADPALRRDIDGAILLSTLIPKLEARN